MKQSDGGGDWEALLTFIVDRRFCQLSATVWWAKERLGRLLGATDMVESISLGFLCGQRRPLDLTIDSEKIQYDRNDSNVSSIQDNNQLLLLATF